MVCGMSHFFWLCLPSHLEALPPSSVVFLDDVNPLFWLNFSFSLDIFLTHIFVTLFLSSVFENFSFDNVDLSFLSQLS